MNWPGFNATMSALISIILSQEIFFLATKNLKNQKRRASGMPELRPLLLVSYSCGEYKGE
jgi:hypothetical protein